MSKITKVINEIEHLENSADMIERFIKNAPFRIVIRRDENGIIEGLCENSFSMSWEKKRVLIFWSGPAYSNFGTTHEIDAIKDAARHYKSENEEVIDPFSDDCPIEINWTKWLTATGKYDKRNAHFVTINPTQGV